MHVLCTWFSHGKLLQDMLLCATTSWVWLCWRTYLMSIAQLRMLNSSTSKPPRQEAATGALQISLLMLISSCL